MGRDTQERPHVRKPGRLTVRVVNPLIAWLTNHGVNVWGAQVLAVRGRSSGEWRTTPVNPLTFEGERYLVAPRGHVQWTRNMRVAGGGELRRGRRVEAFRAEEVADGDKAPVLRGYLRKWKAEVGVFFDGVGPDAPEEQLQAIAHRHPVFRITPV